MRFARALFAGPGACRALVDGARGQVELVLGSSGGAYVRFGLSDWVLLTRPGEPFGPLSVAVDGLDHLELRPGTPAEVTRGRLLVGGLVLSLERMRERRSSPTARAGSGVACVALPAAPATLSVGIAALAGGRVADGVRLLAGLGDGLTPAGDDVLAGYAAARVALGHPVALSRAAAGRSSPLGLAYLRCAERGELPDVAARLLAAICRGRVDEAASAVPRLRTWGSSSGLALGWGINAAAACITRHASRPRTTVTS
jgi:Protein of unknown function (DUF2877)